MKPRRLAALILVAALPFNAAAADPEAERLMERAQFWQERQRDDLAREELAKVFRLVPDHPDALVALARIQLRANQDRDAAATLERLRAAHPGHPAVAQIATALRVRGPDRDKLRLARQLARAGDRGDEAVAAYRAIFGGVFPDDEHALEFAQVLAGTKAGREAGAASIAELARKHPNDPRFKVALATDLSTRRPVAASTLKMLRELVDVPSVARQARAAWREAVLDMQAVEESIGPLREYVEANPADTAVQEKLEKVTQASAAARKLRDDPGYRARREGTQALEAGRLVEAGPLLERAVAIHPDDGEAIGSLGLLRLREGRHADALELFERARAIDPANRARWASLERTARYWNLLRLAREARAAGAYSTAEANANEALALDPAEPAARAELARIYLAAGREREAEPLLGALSADERRSVEDSMRRARAGRLRDRGKELQAQKRDDEALAAFEAGTKLDPLDPWLAHDLARIYGARGEVARGEALFAPILAKHPVEPDARYAYALFLSGVGKDAEGLAQLEAIPAAQRSDGMKSLQRRLVLNREERRVNALVEKGEVAEAERLIEAMRVAAESDPEQQEAVAELKLSLAKREARTLAEASRAAEKEGDVNRAVALEQRSLALAPSDESWRKRRLAELQEKQLAWLGAGLDAIQRSGTPGKSRIDVEEMLLGYRHEWTPAGRPFFRVAPVRVSSGMLDLADAFEVSTYGSMLLCQPTCPAPTRDTERGVAFMAGTEIGNWRVDLGTTPLGFPVKNVVGGALYRGDLGPMSYSVDLSRRALASSLLSFAGARDPNTGRTWGGVVSSGARLNVSRDSGGEYGAWGLAGLYRLSGREVKDNDKLELMAGAYRRFVNEDDRQLAAGLNTLFWRFSENAGEYTLGHGGYYSPRTFSSVSLPVSFAMRRGDTSLGLRASVSISWSESKRAPYFPTDAALQAQAEALAAAGGPDPFYAGGSNGRGYGRSFSAVAEHRLAPNLFVGARLEIDRSTNYTPNRFLLYVRMSPWGVSQLPLAMPPEPVVMPGFQY